VSYGLYASTSSATGWAGYFQGNIYLNGTITLSSDRSLKKDIEALDTANALDEIAALRPVAFTWKKTGVSDMGLIAQEVDPVFPELVTHSGADETLALKYTSLIAPMIASIQELKKRDDDLEIENTALRRDFEAYKEVHP
jgi:Chaperone of endosialidase